MKIIVDKVTVYPPHALCAADARLILSSVPAEWADGILTVRLSAAKQVRWGADWDRFDGIFTVYSRDRTKAEALRCVLRELAIKGLELQFLGGKKLQATHEARVSRLIAPFIEALIPMLSCKKVWLDH